MLKIIFITLCLTPLISGCDNKMDLIKEHINNLTQSTDSIIEKDNAIALNDFSFDNHISYSLAVMKDKNTSLNISDLNKSMNEVLKVTIKVGELSKTWMPVDNKNIYILLRE